MSKNLILSAAAFALLAATAGCVDERDSGLEVRASALGGTNGTCGVGRGGSNDSPSVRAFTRSDGVHMAAFRPVNTSEISQITGTPFTSPITVASGALAGSSPWVYKRHDGATAVLYVDIFQHVHEISVVDGNVDLINAFQPIAPNAAVGNPAPDVIGYVRSDNQSAIVYRGVNDHVIELRSNFNGQPRWLFTDLTLASGAAVTIAKGSAFPYVRSDSWNTIVYIGSDNQIHELASLGSGWQDGSLSAATGDTAVPGTDPWGVKRSDGFNTVLFVGTDGQMHQLALFPGMGGWWTSNIPAVSPRGGLFNRPSAYVRADGLNAVVYTSNDGKIHELRVENNAWIDSVLPTACVRPIGQLFGHPAPGNRSSVVFQGQDTAGTGTIRRYELSLPVGGSWGLTSF